MNWKQKLLTPTNEKMSWLTETKGFNSPSEYERFTNYLAGKFDENELEEIEQEEYYH